MADNESANLLGKDELSSISRFTGSLRTLLFESIYNILKDDEASILINAFLTLF